MQFTNPKDSLGFYRNKFFTNKNYRLLNLLYGKYHSRLKGLMPDLIPVKRLNDKITPSK